MSKAATAQSSAMLENKLAGVRAKHLNVGVGTGLAWLAVAAVALLAVGMFIDWKFNLDKSLRTLLLLVDAVVLLVIFIRHIYTPLTERPSQEEVALEVEKAMPEFRSRLIASTQMAGKSETDSTAAMFVQAMVGQTEEMAKPKDFNSVVSSDGFMKAFVWAVLVVGCGVLAFGKYQPDTGDLLNRAFLGDKPVPRFTHIKAIHVYRVSGDDQETADVIARGDTVLVEIELDPASRIKPKNAEIGIEYANAARPTPHNRDFDTATLKATLRLENVRESFTVIAKANDGEKEREVTVVPRPAVRIIEFAQIYPSYTGLPKKQRQRGDLSLLLGSKLEIDVTANKKIDNGQVVLKDSEGAPIMMEKDGEQVRVTVPLTVASDSSRVTAELNLNDLAIAGFSILLEDEHGFASQDEAFYRIAMMPDKPPVVRVLEPVRKEEKVTQRARLPIMVSVQDDYGVDNLMLMFAIGNSPPQPVVLKAESDIGDKARVAYDWKLSDLKAPVGTEIRYWVEAYDARVPESGVGKSRELIALVVTDDEKRRDLQNRATDSITGINETAAQQEKLNQELGEIIRAQAVTPPQENE